MDTDKIDIFNRLSFDEKAQVIFHNATLLITETKKNIRKNLYGFEGIYLQLTYNVSELKIEKMEAVQLDEVFDYYSNQIELTSLFK